MMDAIRFLSLLRVEDILTGSRGERILQGLKFSAVGIATVMAVLGVIALFTLLFAKIMSKTQGTKTAKAAQPDAPPAADENAPGVRLEGVDDKTAAVIMAIVSDKSGVPLERLRFISIKPVEDGSK